jgi:hypothetical protein
MRRFGRTAVLLLLGVAPVYGAEYPKVTLSDGQIRIQKSAAEAPVQVTHTRKEDFTSAPVVSPDGKLVAYGFSAAGPDGFISPLDVIFIDWDGKEVRRIRHVSIPDLGSDCAFGYPEWIDATRIGVRCEYNPSLQAYLVLNAVSGKVEKEFDGGGFSWSPDRRTLAHSGFVVHFAPPSGQNNCVLFNDNVVYTPGCSNYVKAESARAPILHFRDIHDIYSSFVWSPDGRSVAFVETVFDFDWGTDEKGEETRENVNPRYYLAIVSANRRAVGYSSPEPLPSSRIEWLSNTRIRLADPQNKSFERVFDLTADPPKPIP